MTEEEARKKWCPMSRNVISGNITSGVNPIALAMASGNQFPDDKRSGCIASECMMWRWTLTRGEGRCGLAGE